MLRQGSLVHAPVRCPSMLLDVRGRPSSESQPPRPPPVAAPALSMSRTPTDVGGGMLPVTRLFLPILVNNARLARPSRRPWAQEIDCNNSVVIWGPLYPRPGQRVARGCQELARPPSLLRVEARRLALVRVVPTLSIDRAFDSPLADFQSEHNYLHFKTSLSFCSSFPAPRLLLQLEFMSLDCAAPFVLSSFIAPPPCTTRTHQLHTTHQSATVQTATMPRMM